MRCRLILLISEHPIQQGIRKGGGPYFRLRTDEDGRRGRTEWVMLQKIKSYKEKSIKDINKQQSLPLLTIGQQWNSYNV